MSQLDKINNPNDIYNIKSEELDELCFEIRKRIIKATSINGGHVASNLGAVELTVALHRFLHFPEDKLIWDVGHQSYAHKILTGRKDAILKLRNFGEISGFPKPNESDCDAFATGHSSTSVSAALGYAKARDLRGGNEKIVAVIGDGALTGGLALEGLNNAANIRTNMIIVLNDNERSISENVGGMANYLGRIRTSRSYKEFKTGVEDVLSNVPKVGDRIAEKLKVSRDIVKRVLVPGMLFEDMGLTYMGPIDGHNIHEMQTAFFNASRVKGAVIVHVITKKGKGYRHAEEHPAQFHGVSPFVIKTGEPVGETEESFTDVFSKTLFDIIDKDRKVVAITAAMSYGTGLYNIKKTFPKNFFDVGIAEEHAVTFAAGLARGGIKPVVCVYSTFLQRAYDQIMVDVALQKLNVIFAIDRAGLVGKDGETHQGVFDVAYLSSIPGMTILSPRDGHELDMMLRYAMTLDGPVAIRYPRGDAEGSSEKKDGYAKLELNTNDIVRKRGEDDQAGIAICTTGIMFDTAVKVYDILAAQGHAVSLVNIRFLNGMDMELLKKLSENHDYVVMIEENVKSGSYGSRMAAAIAEEGIGMRPILCSLPDAFIQHGSVERLRKEYGLTAEEIVERILSTLTA